MILKDHYQIEKNDPHEWHEYGVRATKEGKFVDLTGVGEELYERIVKYYEEQGVTVKKRREQPSTKDGSFL